jgi:HEAT repeat protein
MMDCYVPPKSYESIKQHLAQKHAVVITGPSGTGKTLTADILEIAYRKVDPPFLVVGGENGPGPVRDHLSSAQPVLFHLRDPWGSNRLTSTAERWSAELPKLITQAGPSHKFLVTSRSDVLHSAGLQLGDLLAPFIVPIEIEDYGREQLGDIYDGISSALTGNAANLAKQYRKKALTTLTRPYEIDRFLSSLTAENPEKPKNIEDLLKASQIDAIATVVADEILGWQPDGASAAAVIWAMLKARDAVTVDTLRGINRILRLVDPGLRPDIDGMTDFLVAGRNLRRDSNVITFYHPRVEDGLRIAIEKKRNQTEYLLTSLANGLIASDEEGQDWGVETALVILKLELEIKGFHFTLSPTNHARMDDFLESRYRNAQRVGEFENSFDDMARFGSTDHVPSAIACILARPDKKDDEPSFGRFWSAPSVSNVILKRIQTHPRTQLIIETFIREILPFSRTYYRESLIPLLHSFAPELGNAFREAADIVAEPGGPSDNIGVIVEGACRYTPDNFDWVLERFVECEDKANQWMEGFRSELRKAEEHEVDAAYADHVYEQPQEQYYNSSTGLEAAVGLRYELQGISWLSDHRDRDRLAGYLSRVLRENGAACPPHVLRELVACSAENNRVSAWKVIERHWDQELDDLLTVELTRSDIAENELRQTLIRVTAHSNADPVSRIAEVLSKMPPFRRLEILRDLLTTQLQSDPESEAGVMVRRNRATALLTYFSGEEGELARALVDILGGEQLDSVAKRLAAPVKDLLLNALANAPLTVVGPLACLAAASGMDVEQPAHRLLTDGEAITGLEAIQALVLRPYEKSSNQLHSTLRHPMYRVRCQTLQELVKLVGDEERTSLALAAEDDSADVRLLWAELMQKEQWLEAVPSLIALLADCRNFDNDPGILSGPSWSRFSVARAAAHALGAYRSISKEATDALMRVAENSSKDPFVPCAAIAALADKDGARISALLVRSLASRGLRSSPEHRPLAQAASWALFDRALSGKLKFTEEDVLRSIEDSNPAISAPVLMAVGAADINIADKLISALRDRDLPYRVELLLTAVAMFHGVAMSGAEEHHTFLASLYPIDEVEQTDVKFPKLAEWTLSLDSNRDVQGYTAWLVSMGLRLPVRATMSDPRAFDLPQRIGIFSLRSLTPARELADRSVDTGL